MITPTATSQTSSHGQEAIWLEMKHPKRESNNKLFFVMLQEYCKFPKLYSGGLFKVYSLQFLPTYPGPCPGDDPHPVQRGAEGQPGL